MNHDNFTGGIGGQPKIPSVIGLFKRDSIGSISNSRRGSLQSLHHVRMDSPRHSIGSDGSSASAGFEMRMTSQRGEDGDSGGSSSGNVIGVVPRRGSTFLSTATPILEEETEETEEREGSRSSSSQFVTRPTAKIGAGAGEIASGSASESAEAGSPATSPPHSKPTSPLHVSTKPQLQQIDEDEAPISGVDVEPTDNDNDVSDPHTKL